MYLSEIWKALMNHEIVKKENVFEGENLYNVPKDGIFNMLPNNQERSSLLISNWEWDQHQHNKESYGHIICNIFDG